MIIKNVISIFLLILFSGCTKERDCDDIALQPAFIGFAPSDIDTFILRKFNPGNSYQKLISDD